MIATYVDSSSRRSASGGQRRALVQRHDRAFASNPVSWTELRHDCAPHQAISRLQHAL